MPKQAKTETKRGWPQSVAQRFPEHTAARAKAVGYQRQLHRLFLAQLVDSARLNVSNAMCTLLDRFSDDDLADTSYLEMRERLVGKFQCAWAHALAELDDMVGYAEDDARSEQLVLQPELIEDPYLVPRRT